MTPERPISAMRWPQPTASAAGAWTPESKKTRRRIGARVMLQVRNRKKKRGKSLNKALVPIVRVLLLNLADTARIRARELGNRRTEEEEGRNRGRRRKKQQNTIGGRFQFVFFIARSSPVDSYIVHYKASWPTKRPMAGDNNFGPKPETVRNGLLPAHSFAIRYRCCRTVTSPPP